MTSTVRCAIVSKLGRNRPPLSGYAALSGSCTSRANGRREKIAAKEIVFFLPADEVSLSPVKTSVHVEGGCAGSLKKLDRQTVCPTGKVSGLATLETRRGTATMTQVSSWRRIKEHADSR
jgi:hypothetical protein